MIQQFLFERNLLLSFVLNCFSFSVSLIPGSLDCRSIVKSASGCASSHSNAFSIVSDAPLCTDRNNRGTITIYVVFF